LKPKTCLTGGTLYFLDADRKTAAASGNQITGAACLGTVGLDWQLAGVAPVHGVGASDLVLRNGKTGQFEVYNMPTIN
jgi:hypothetical protein